MATPDVSIAKVAISEVKGIVDVDKETLLENRHHQAPKEYEGASKSAASLTAEQGKAARRQIASDFAMEMSGAYKPPKQLVIYLAFAFFPVFLAIAAQVAILSGAYPKVVLPHVAPYLALSIPVLAFLTILELYVAYKQGKLMKYFRFNDSVSSGFTVAVESGILLLTRNAFTLVPYAFINAHWSISGIRDEDTTWLHWWVMFIIVELGYYWAHRMGHEWNFIWAGHNIHHSSDEYNLFTALRQNFFFGIFGGAFYLPIAMVFPIKLFALHKAINTLYQFWIHTRFIERLPAPIEYIFNTPSHHRVHHGRNPQYIDKNYGGTLILFDRLFGTFEPEVEEVVYGITHMPDTWNPIYVHFHHWFEMIETAKLTPGLWRKIRVFLDLGPGYNYFLLHYVEVSNLKAPPTEKLTPATIKKRLVSVPNGQMKFYTAIQYLMLTAEIGGVIVFTTSAMMWFRILIVAHILLQEITVSALLDRRPWAAYADALRCVLSFGVLLYSAAGLIASAFNATVVIGGLFFSGSIAWVLYYQRESMATNFDGLEKPKAH